MQVIDYGEMVSERAATYGAASEVNPEKSPFEDIPRITLNITTAEIVKLFQECRAGV